MGEVAVTEKPFQGRRVGEIGFDEGEVRIVLQLGQTVPLELDAVVVVQIVEAGHPVPLCKEAFCKVKADKARDTGDQNVHEYLLCPGKIGQERGARKGRRMCRDGLSPQLPRWNGDLQRRDGKRYKGGI